MVDDKRTATNEGKKPTLLTRMRTESQGVIVQIESHAVTEKLVSSF